MNTKLLSVAALCSSLLTPMAARADDWGCQVLLCLSNPAGPMAVAACVPPIQRLYAAIFKWRPDPFPTCTLSDGSDSSTGGNYAYVAPPSYYDACPSGTVALAAGVNGAEGTPSAARASRWGGTSGFTLTSSVTAGIGDGAGLSPGWGDDYAPLPVKTCVGNHIGNTVLTSGWGRDTTRTNISVYDRVVHINPGSTSFNINVIVNGALYRNIRPNL